VAATEDNTTEYGSITVTVGANTYVLENVSVNRPMTKIRRRDEIGEPAGSVYVPDFVEGTATAQYEIAPPALGGEFTTTLNSTDGSETFIVTGRGDEFTQDDIRKMPIQFDKKLS
jgi:hypothetical protein